MKRVAMAVVPDDDSLAYLKHPHTSGDGREHLQIFFRKPRQNFFLRVRKPRKAGTVETPETFLEKLKNTLMEIGP